MDVVFIGAQPQAADTTNLGFLIQRKIDRTGQLVVHHPSYGTLYTGRPALLILVCSTGTLSVRQQLFREAACTTIVPIWLVHCSGSFDRITHWLNRPAFSNPEGFA